MKKILSVLSSIIKYIWIIVIILSVLFLNSACTTPNKVRNGSTHRIFEKKDNNKINSSKYEKEINNKTESSNKYNDNISGKEIVFPVIDENDDKPKKILPIREQMKLYTEQQEKMSMKVEKINNDMAEIKNSITEIKSVIKNMDKKYFNEAIAGEPIVNNNISQEKKTDKKIYPDYDDNEYKSYNKSNKPSIKNVTNSPKKIKEDSFNKPNKNKGNIKFVKNANDNTNTNTYTNIKQISYEKDDNEQESNEISIPLKYIEEKDYQKAIVELSNLSTGGNSGELTNKCHYWLAESYFALNQFDKSMAYFKKVINSKYNYKKDNAQIMLAECYIRNGKMIEAKKAFQDLVDYYPKSNYISRAKKMLQQM